MKPDYELSDYRHRFIESMRKLPGFTEVTSMTGPSWLGPHALEVKMYPDFALIRVPLPEELEEIPQKSKAG